MTVCSDHACSPTSLHPYLALPHVYAYRLIIGIRKKGEPP